MDARSIFRLLDASANRAREGLRTTEDFIRFALDNGPRSRKLKQARQDVTALMKQVAPDETWLDARQATADCGRPQSGADTQSPEVAEEPAGATDKTDTAGVSIGREGVAPAKSVAVRGLKRAQEALRSLEEYSRAAQPEVSQRFAALRFGLYDQEQWLVTGSEAEKIIASAQLYVLLTEAYCRNDWLQTARAVLKGGTRILQLREKHLPAEELAKRARQLQELCREHEAVFVMNDRVDVAVAEGADAVHVGQDDLSPAAIRRVGGQGLLIGRSTHSVAQAKQAVEDGVAYIAVGSMWPTASKAGFTLAGPTLARDVRRLYPDVPCFAIGGITQERLSELSAAGVRGVAVSSAVIGAEDPERAARDMVDVLANAQVG